MRVSKLFGQTLREPPAEAEMISHQLMLRAGLIRPLAAGIFQYLPLGWRVLRNIADIMREEMDAIGGQEMLMPLANPAEIWRATGRFDSPAPGPVLLRFRDRTGHDMVLALSHEECVTDLLRSEVHSYRQLPFVVYHIQTKFRDEPRTRGGLVRSREFTMKDAYSCHTDRASLDAFYERISQAYVRVYQRCGVPAIPVVADVGTMGGTESHEFMVFSDQGEDTLVVCSSCGSVAHVEAATIHKPDGAEEAEGALAEVATPGCTTIAQVAAFMGVSACQTLKALFYTAQDGKVVMALIRGDLEANVAKLSNALGGADVRPSTQDELCSAGVVPGYASPIGLSGIPVVADDSIALGSNFVAGANREGFHYVNVNYPRDFAVLEVTDIVQARAGDRCPECGGRLESQRSIEVGHLFKLGTQYSEAVGATYLDSDGKARPIVMGSYGISLGRLVAVIVEENHDNRGIVWPPSVAPYQCHLLSLGSTSTEVTKAAEDLYHTLTTAGLQVLYDDRAERAGVMFKDADLIGIPWRVVLSGKTLSQQTAEVKRRSESSARLLPLHRLGEALSELVATGGG